MFRRKKQNVIQEQSYYDSDAAYRGQSIYGSAPIYSQQSMYSPASNQTGYVPPTMGYQPPNPYGEERPAEVGYRPPLFPGSSELAEVAPEPEPEEKPKELRAAVFQRSVQSVANAFKKVQERAIKSTQNQREETEEEKSIKALFAERIVKGRPDLFTPSSPVPSPHSEDPEEPKESKEPKKDATTPRLNILQANLSGFFGQFSKQQETSSLPQGKWGERLRDFNKRFGRSDAKYLRDAVSNFCEETRRMYATSLPPTYVETPLNSPREDGSEVITNSTPAIPTPMTPATQQKAASQPLEDRIHSFTDALMTEIRKHKGWRGADDQVFGTTRDCVEKMLIEELRGYTLGAVREEMKKEDDELTEKLSYLEFLTVDHLGVSAVCKEHPEVLQKVTEQLQEISRVVSPAEKLECIIEACRTLGALLASGSKNDAGADDFLPAFIYIVMKSKIPKLPSTVEFISRYRHPDELLSEGGYCLTNLSGAVSFLQNCGGCDFDIDVDEFERQYNKSAPVPVVDEEEEDLLMF